MCVDRHLTAGGIVVEFDLCLAVGVGRKIGIPVERAPVVIFFRHHRVVGMIEFCRNGIAVDHGAPCAWRHGYGRIGFDEYHASVAVNIPNRKGRIGILEFYGTLFVDIDRFDRFEINIAVTDRVGEI